MGRVTRRRYAQDVLWDVSRVTTMGGMFAHATSFNMDLSNWDVSRVTGMTGMFFCATSFNADLCKWNVLRVTNMYVVFACLCNLL